MSGCQVARLVRVGPPGGTCGISGGIRKVRCNGHMSGCQVGQGRTSRGDVRNFRRDPTVALAGRTPGEEGNRLAGLSREFRFLSEREACGISGGIPPWRWPADSRGN